MSIENIQLDGAFCQVYRQYLDENKARDLYSFLEKNMPWSKSDLTLYGKKLKTPRFQCWMGDDNVKAEVYSNTRVNWDPNIMSLKEKLEDDLSFKFNYLLLNYYKTGADYIGYHRDSEVLQDSDLIGSLSLGGTRRFLIGDCSKKKLLELELNNGDLMVMDGSMQRKYKHSVPKTVKKVDGRINLTFRKAKTK